MKKKNVDLKEPSVPVKKKAASTKKSATKKTTTKKSTTTTKKKASATKNVKTNIEPAVTKVKTEDSSVNKGFITNIFSPHTKQFDETKEKRIIVLIAFCCFICILVAFMCLFYIGVTLYSIQTVPNGIIAKEDISELKEGNNTLEDASSILNSEIADLEAKIKIEKDKQTSYDTEDSFKATLTKQRDELKTDLDNVKKLIEDSKSKITSLKNKIKDLEALIEKNN